MLKSERKAKSRYTISLNEKNPVEQLIIEYLQQQPNAAGAIKLALVQKVMQSESHGGAMDTKKTRNESVMEVRGAQLIDSEGIGDFGGAL